MLCHILQRGTHSAATRRALRKGKWVLRAHTKNPQSTRDRGRFYDTNRLCLFLKKQGTQMRILIYINGWISAIYGLVIQRLECATHNPVILIRVQASPPKYIFNYICFLIKENVYLQYSSLKLWLGGGMVDTRDCTSKISMLNILQKQVAPLEREDVESP